MWLIACNQAIVVAIPALIAHKVFRAKIDNQIHIMEKSAQQIITLCNAGGK